MSAQQRMDERDRQRKEQQQQLQPKQPEKTSSEKKRKPAALSSPKAKKVKKAKTKAPKMPKKDPNEPKRPLSSFMMFSQKHREAVKAANPESSFGNLGKLLGDRWKKVSAEEKSAIELVCAENKATYAIQHKTYMESDARQQWEAAMIEQFGEIPGTATNKKGSGKGGGKSTKKKTKDKGPKRACTAYAYFTGAKRAGIKTANPDASFGDIARLVSAAWKECSDEDKQEFVALADADKVRATKDKQEWDAAHPEEVKAAQTMLTILNDSGILVLLNSKQMTILTNTFLPNAAKMGRMDRCKEQLIRHAPQILATPTKTDKFKKTVEEACVKSKAAAADQKKAKEHADQTKKSENKGSKGSAKGRAIGRKNLEPLRRQLRLNDPPPPAKEDPYTPVMFYPMKGPFQEMPQEGDGVAVQEGIDVGARGLRWGLAWDDTTALK